jgi:PIN domain nuclease of toxin-antitoxin system
MNLLLDTHVVLWWLDDNPSLSSRARSAVADSDNTVFISAAVIWEIRIKQALGKLKLPRNLRDVLDRQPFTSLPITAEHAHAVSELPAYHRDPFDRILLAQAKVERLTFVTHDKGLRQYQIPILDA